METIKGKYIWIIGASSGIGAALAHELAAQGAKVAISARREEKLEEVISALPGDGHLLAPADVSKPEQLSGALSEILKIFPHVDSVLFMPAMYKPHDGQRPPLKDLHLMLDVNLGGAFNLLDCILPHLEARQNGQVVLCASVAGYRGLPKGQPYCATKAALISLGESLRTELEPKNIDVKIICPGFVKTPLTDKNNFPMPFIIEADEAARCIAKGLCAKGFDIHFPKRMTLIMKTLKILPNWLYFIIARKVLYR